jgi:isopentenyl diphosphate isomerase/L-lactate dehydrogenase-like FMN-dependent dehydrogenase
MAKWICTVCGYIHEGKQPPDQCPVCGAPKEDFKKLTKKEAKELAAAAEAVPQSLAEVRDRARDRLSGICAVYPACNGASDNICQREAYGRPIGLGGAGSGASFRANYDSLARLRLKTRLVGHHFEPDTTLDFLGQLLSMPVMGASTSGIERYKAGLNEKQFCQACLQGCLQAGTLSWRGDTFFYTFEDHPGLEALEEEGGRGIPIFKPRAQDAIKKLIERAEKANCPAVGLDLDGCGSTNMAAAGQPVYRKSSKEIEELVNSTSLPFIAKGIMAWEDAVDCAEAGVKVVGVSNHGGRVLDSTPGVAEVLPAIVERLKGRVLVTADGGVRTGYDVLKMLALGADAVLVGRDVIRAAVGGAAAGVQMHMDRLGSVLSKAMIMTGCPDLKSIDGSVLE